MQQTATVLEVERKFVCKDFDNFQNFILQQPFSSIEQVDEKDDYFVDINKDFLSKKICLRIRKSGTKVELTYKGPSISALDPCAKIEYSISVSSEHIDAMSTVLEHLGYQNYVSVEKKRVLYKKTYSDLIYTIAIDYISHIGYFVEFEIMALDEKKYDKKHVLSLLDFWLDDYRKFDFEEIYLPYRDLVAESLNKNLI